VVLHPKVPVERAVLDGLGQMRGIEVDSFSLFEVIHL
jgi:hypothetical protein